MSMLKCSRCGDDNLYVSSSYDGLDCNSLQGDGSGFNSKITLTCAKCNCVYVIGRIRNEMDFTVDTDANHFTYENLGESRKFPKVSGTSEIKVNESQKAILKRILFKELDQVRDYWDKRNAMLKKLHDKKVVDAGKRIVQAAEDKAKNIEDLIKQLSN